MLVFGCQHRVCFLCVGRGANPLRPTGCPVGPLCMGSNDLAPLVATTVSNNIQPLQR